MSAPYIKLNSFIKCVQISQIIFFQVLPSGVGVVGSSKGGDLALSVATFIPKVKAAVCINGCTANAWYNLQVHGTTIPGLGVDLSKIKVSVKV